MKKCFSFLLIAGVAAMFVSCNDNEEIEKKQESNLLSITASWVGSNVTRALKTGFEVGDELGLYITDGTLDNLYNSKSEYSNVKSIFGGSNWTQETNVYLDNKEATVYAYFPYSSSAGNGKSIPVESSTQTDYMHGVSTTKATVMIPSVNVEMKHALAQLAFKITTKNYSGNGLLQEVRVSNLGAGNSVYVKGVMNCQTGIVAGTEIGTLALSTNHALSITETIFTAITIPVAQTTGKTIQLTFKIDNVNYIYELPAGTVWNAGTKNVYSITLEGKNLNIGNVTIKPWEEIINGEIKLTPVVS